MQSHSDRVAVLALLFLSASVLFAAPQDRPVNTKEHQLTKKEVKALIVSARTSEDHMKLALYFRGEAKQQEASVMYHEEMAELYESNPIAEGEMAKHCKSLSESLKMTAEAANSVAVEHERMAAQLRYTPVESNLLQESFPQRVDESSQQDMFEACINSTRRVESHAHSMMPSRFWTFDSEEYRQRLGRLRLSAETLSQNQAAFEESLTPEQVMKSNSEVHGVHQFQAEIEFRVKSIDHELRKHQPAKWGIARDTEAIRKLAKAWRKRDQKIARRIGIFR